MNIDMRQPTLQKVRPKKKTAKKAVTFKAKTLKDQPTYPMKYRP